MGSIVRITDTHVWKNARGVIKFWGCEASLKVVTSRRMSCPLSRRPRRVRHCSTKVGSMQSSSFFLSSKVGKCFLRNFGCRTRKTAVGALAGARRRKGCVDVVPPVFASFVGQRWATVMITFPSRARSQGRPCRLMAGFVLASNRRRRSFSPTAVSWNWESVDGIGQSRTVFHSEFSSTGKFYKHTFLCAIECSIVGVVFCDLK